MIETVESAEELARKSSAETTREITELLDKLYGRNLIFRCNKMEEEFNEYKEVVKKSDVNMDDVIDELADLNIIVFHSASILGITQHKLLEMAYDKIRGRQTDPNYKRKHRHDIEYCGNCRSFTDEDINGNGYCDMNDILVNCETPCCNQWEKNKDE